MRAQTTRCATRRGRVDRQPARGVLNARLVKQGGRIFLADGLRAPPVHTPCCRTTSRGFFQQAKPENRSLRSGTSSRKRVRSLAAFSSVDERSPPSEPGNLRWDCWSGTRRESLQCPGPLRILKTGRLLVSIADTIDGLTTTHTGYVAVTTLCTSADVMDAELINQANRFGGHSRAHMVPALFRRLLGSIDIGLVGCQARKLAWPQYNCEPSAHDNDFELVLVDRDCDSPWLSISLTLSDCGAGLLVLSVKKRKGMLEANVTNHWSPSEVIVLGPTMFPRCFLFHSPSHCLLGVV